MYSGWLLLYQGLLGVHRDIPYIPRISDTNDNTEPWNIRRLDQRDLRWRPRILFSPGGTEDGGLSGKVQGGCNHTLQSISRVVSDRRRQNFRGYSPLYGEKSSNPDLEPEKENDSGALCESFDIGYELVADHRKTPKDKLPPDTYGLLGENQWPEETGFRDVYRRYFADAMELARSLMRIFALALNLKEDFFDEMMVFPGVTSRILHYPPQPVPGEEIPGLAAHTVSLAWPYGLDGFARTANTALGLRMLHDSIAMQSSGSAGPEQPWRMGACAAHSWNPGCQHFGLFGVLVRKAPGHMCPGKC